MNRVLADDDGYPIDVAAAVLAGLDVLVEALPRPWSGEDVVGVLTWYPLTAADMALLPALRAAVTYSVGYDHIDVAAAGGRGIRVANVPDYCVEEMADHALAMLLSLVRGVVELDRSVRGGVWDLGAAAPPTRIAEHRLGVLGFGRIGRALARRAAALGMKVAAHDPWVDEATMRSTGVEPLGLDELLARSTAISLHMPLTPETTRLIGERELRLLPAGAYVVNVSRAGLADTEALLAALDTGHLGGVALDVLDVEPPTAAHPAPQRPRLVVNPHSAWFSPTAEEACYRLAAEAVRDVLLGRTPVGAVN